MSVQAAMPNVKGATVVALATTAIQATTYNAGYFEYVRVNPTGGAFAVNLPTAVNRKNFVICVKNVTTSTNAVTLTPNGAETIDGALTKAITAGYGSCCLISDGANWLIQNTDAAVATQIKDLRQNNTANTVVANTTTETNLDSFTINAGTLVVGDLVRIRADGQIVNNDTAPANFRLRVELDGNAILDTTDIEVIPGVNPGTWKLETGFAVRTIGATGTVRPLAGSFSIDNTPETAHKCEQSTDNNADIVVDTTGALNLVVTIEMSVADVALTTTLINSFVHVESV